MVIVRKNNKNILYTHYNNILDCETSGSTFPRGTPSQFCINFSNTRKENSTRFPPRHRFRELRKGNGKKEQEGTRPI